jgi:acyl transferase domain-containing protein
MWPCVARPGRLLGRLLATGRHSEPPELHKGAVSRDGRGALASSARVCVVFSGQGSQYCRMASRLLKAHPSARFVYQAVDEALGLRLTALMTNGSMVGGWMDGWAVLLPMPAR